MVNADNGESGKTGDDQNEHIAIPRIEVTEQCCPSCGRGSGRKMVDAAMDCLSAEEHYRYGDRLQVWSTVTKVGMTIYFNPCIWLQRPRAQGW